MSADFGGCRPRGFEAARGRGASDPSSVVRGMDGTNSFSGWVNRGVIRMRMPNERFRSKWGKEGRSDAAKEGRDGSERVRAASSALLPFFLLRKPFLLGRLPSYLLRSLSLNRPPVLPPPLPIWNRLQVKGTQRPFEGTRRRQSGEEGSEQPIQRFMSSFLLSICGCGGRAAPIIIVLPPDRHPIRSSHRIGLPLCLLLVAP